MKFKKYREGDEIELVNLHNRCFNSKISLEYWYWKYLQNPNGFEISIATDKNGKIIGQYCTQFRKGVFYGKYMNVLGIVDLCVDEEFRNMGFYASAVKFQYSLKHSKLPYVNINFPKKKMISIASKHGYNNGVINVPIYHKRINYLKFLFNFNNKPINGDIKIKFLNNLSSIKSKINFLWKKKESELQISVIRDAPYIEWQIFKFPGKTYFFSLEKKNQLIGYFSIFNHNKISYIQDILILNSYLSDAIFNAIEQICYKLKSSRISIMIYNKEIEDFLVKHGYKIKDYMSLLHFNNLKYKGDFFPYITYTDGDILDQLLFR